MWLNLIFIGETHLKSRFNRLYDIIRPELNKTNEYIYIGLSFGLNLIK